MIVKIGRSSFRRQLGVASETTLGAERGPSFPRIPFRFPPDCGREKRWSLFFNDKPSASPRMGFAVPEPLPKERRRLTMLLSY